MAGREEVVVEGEWTDATELTAEEIDDLESEMRKQAQTHEPEVQETVTTFPEKWRIPFEGLMYLGYLEKTVEIPFHKFVIRTLMPAEKIEVALICRELQDTFGYNRGYKAACIAAALVSADGEPILVSEKQRGAVRQKYEYVINTWHDVIIDILYQAVNELELEVAQLLHELGVIELPGQVPAGKDGSSTLTSSTTPI